MEFPLGRTGRPAHNLISNRSLKYMNYPLLFIVVFLSLLGLVAIFSASAIYAENKGLGTYSFLRRQGLWLFLGMTFAAVAARVDLERLREYIKPAFAVTALLLLITLFMHPVANVRRWLPLGFMRLQTSELAKLAIVFYLADFMDRNISSIQANWKTLIKPTVAVGVLLGLILLEPDLGTPALLFAVMMMLYATAGLQMKYVMAPVAAGALGVLGLIIATPYRMARLTSFMSPWEHMDGAGFQLAQSLLAVGSGGWFGKGFGASKLKLSYLPEAHTDFIFPIFAEETGLLGTLAVVALFTALLVKGARIARNAQSMYTSLAALGFTLLIVLQAFFNIGMSIGLLPTKGIALPFFSYGGSSIMSTLIMAGVILNISAHRSGPR